MHDGATLPEDTAGLLARGLEEIRAGRYFEAHDLLEEAWSGTRGPGRDGLKGLVQLAVACYHLEAGNRRGAESMMAKALHSLEGQPAGELPLRLGPLRERLASALQELRDGGSPDPSALAMAVEP